jgi:hypothetical protein
MLLHYLCFICMLSLFNREDLYLRLNILVFIERPWIEYHVCYIRLAMRM